MHAPADEASVRLPRVRDRLQAKIEGPCSETNTNDVLRLKKSGTLPFLVSQNMHLRLKRFLSTAGTPMTGRMAMGSLK
jgi:hypothetical protein